MTLKTNGWRAAMTLVAACAAVVALGGTASAQVTLAFKSRRLLQFRRRDDRRRCRAGGRSHREPPLSSRARRRAASEERVARLDRVPRVDRQSGADDSSAAGGGEWWLVLFDGKRLVARTTFDVFDMGTVLELMHRDICSKIKSVAERSAKAVDGITIRRTRRWSGPPSLHHRQPSLLQPRRRVPAAASKRLRLLLAGEIRADARVEVAVSDSGQTRALELRWAERRTCRSLESSWHRLWAGHFQSAPGSHRLP